jgi:DNA (cytosine-5)-methyltransferase 1
MAFTFIDLFAGIGGMRIAFEKAGGECVFSSEWDKFAQQTYAANFGETPHGDITQVELEEVPKHDILIGGFPCQPFSHAGLKRGFEDTRGTLFFDVARIIDHRKPSMVLLENVKGFTTHDRGRTMAVVKETLEDLGYNVFHKVLNARDFGVPQNRERVFIVAINRKKLGNIGFEYPFPKKIETKLGDILDSRVDEKYTISNKLWAGHKRRLAEHRAKGNGFGYSLFNANSTYTSTISARYYKDGSEILIEQKNANPRKLTPREAARLQGFPEEFKIPVSDNQAYKQFGNSVAVPVIYAIAKNLVKLIESPESRIPFSEWKQLQLLG